MKAAGGVAGSGPVRGHGGMTSAANPRGTGR